MTADELYPYPAERDMYDRVRYPRHAHYIGCHFCADFDRRAKEAALAAALNNGDQSWQRRAMLWVEAKDPGHQFTADDLVGDLGVPEWISTNAIGALFNKMAKGGTIIPVGYTNARRLSSHSRVLRIWQRT